MASATAAPAESTAQGPASRSRLEDRVFAVATVVGLCHALDDAVLDRQPAVPVDQHLGALLVTVVGAVVGMVVFRFGRPGLRAVIALTFGVLTATNGALHVIDVARVGVSGSDVSGILAAAAGAVLVVLGAAIAFVHRSERGGGRGVRWLRRGLVMLGVLLWVGYVVLPIAVAIVQTHKFREPIGDPPRGYEDVSFEATDGLRLSGWYTPSRNRAAVVVVSSARGDRTGSVEHADFLAAHGYGVLVYDARGSGRSEGTPNGYGWTWDRDVRGALEFLQSRPDVDPHRIGGLGLSTGADVLIEVAAGDDELRAVVADGATGRRVADLPPGNLAERPMLWTMFTAVRVLSGTEPGPPLKDLVAKVSPTPLLLIASGSLPTERPMNAIYARAAHEPVTLWDLPDVDHTAALTQRPQEYERQVIGHLDRALLSGG